ncbi:MAG: hypothetical protein AAB288_13715, partial [Acidobacteriota bacterium]
TCAANIGGVGFAIKRRAQNKKDGESPPAEEPGTPLRIEPKPDKEIEKAEKFMKSVAFGIIRMVRPYQKVDPLKLRDLYSIWCDDYGKAISESEFYKILDRLFDQRRLPGLVRRGEDIFIEEAHYLWKTTFAEDDKKLIAKEAVKYIKSGDIIAIDSGSTTLPIAKEIAEGIRTNRFENVVVVTNFFKAVDELLNVAMEKGLSDDDPVLKIYITGGRVRLNTLAIVDDNESVRADVFNNFHDILASFGGADIGFVGTSGVARDGGFTSASREEFLSKQSILEHSKRKFIVTDPSKFGMRQEHVFAKFDMGIEIITTKHGDRRILRDYEQYFLKTGTKMIYAE